MSASAENPNGLMLEVIQAASLDGQAGADELAVSDRNGCFEFCDGFPEELTDEYVGLIRDATESSVERDAILARAADHKRVLSGIYSAVRNECPSGYSLFDSDDELYDEAGNPVQRPCPMHKRITETLVELRADKDD